MDKFNERGIVPEEDDALDQMTAATISPSLLVITARYQPSSTNHGKSGKSMVSFPIERVESAGENHQSHELKHFSA